MVDLGACYIFTSQRVFDTGLALFEGCYLTWIPFSAFSLYLPQHQRPQAISLASWVIPAALHKCAPVRQVKTKRSSLALLKKQYEEESKVPNRSARRQKKAFGKKKASATPAAAAAATNEQLPLPPTAETPVEAPAAPKKGMFEGVKETLDAVNKQSYYQALALNKELEDKGVLPPVERKPAPPGGDKEGGVVAEGRPELAAEAAVAAGVPEGRGAAAVSQGGGSKRRKKGKGGKKGKRK